MSSDPVPDGLTAQQRLSYLIGAVVQNARALEGRLELLPGEHSDPEIVRAIANIRGLERQVRAERNLIVHGEPPDLESVRGTAQVLRRVRIQVDALERVLAGDPERARLLRIASGNFRVDADGNAIDVPEFDLGNP